MLNHSIKSVALGAALALTVGGTWAQTATTPTTNIGVTPQNANEATQKAVPQANTGTLVRTDPSAAARAEEAAKDVGNAVTPNTRAAAPTVGSTGTSTGASTGTTAGARTDATNNTSAAGTTNNTTTNTTSGTNMGSNSRSTPSTAANDNNTLVSGNTNRNSNRNARPLRADRN